MMARSRPPYQDTGFSFVGFQPTGAGITENLIVKEVVNYLVKVCRGFMGWVYGTISLALNFADNFSDVCC